jgi:hypothetical protein
VWHRRLPLLICVIFYYALPCIFFSRNMSDFAGLSRDEILHLAEDCAQDALMAARRERWKEVSLDALSFSQENTFYDWLLKGRAEDVAQEQSAIQDEVRAIIRDVVEHDLTDKQRRVLILMVFHEVPMDEVVRHTWAQIETRSTKCCTTRARR